MRIIALTADPRHWFFRAKNSIAGSSERSWAMLVEKYLRRPKKGSNPRHADNSMRERRPRSTRWPFGTAKISYLGSKL
jgi:hypothetical protein